MVTSNAWSMSIHRTRDAPHPLDQIGRLAAPRMVGSLWAPGRATNPRPLRWPRTTSRGLATYDRRRQAPL